jgi:hypothetical protein
MKLLQLTVSLLAMMSSVQCERDSGQRIPVGVYEEPSGQERVVAKEKTLEVGVRLVGGDGRQGEIVRNEYRYRVLTTGEILMSGTSSDAVFGEGVLRFQWSWDGTRIIRKRVEPVRDKEGNVVATKPGPPVVFASKAQEH